MKLTVSSGFTGVIATGSYENARPNFTASVEFELTPAQQKSIDSVIGSWEKRLYDISYQNFKQAEQAAIVERVAKERQGIRWYPLPNGELVPSVSSITGWDADWFVSPEQLSLLASESIMRHGQVSTYWDTGKWKKPQDIEGIFADYMICKQAGVELQANGFISFLEKYPFKHESHDQVVLNPEHRYGGTYDYVGVPEENKKENIKAVRTVCDVKRTPDIHKNFMQMAAYAKCIPECQQMMIVILNDKTKQGYSKPIVSTSIDKYFELFLKKREGFRKRYRA